MTQPLILKNISIGDTLFKLLNEHILINRCHLSESIWKTPLQGQNHPKSDVFLTGLKGRSSSIK